MSQPKIQIAISGGRGRNVPRPSSESTPPTNLADFLDAKGFPLNTRCNQRGLCRGCEVVLVDSVGTRQKLRACRVDAATACSDIASIEIPEGSCHNRSLHGVSVFEIRVPAPGPDPGRGGIGLALDIGTTTLAAALWDYASGQCLAHGSRANPQGRYGDNVLSRITHADGNPEGARQLQSTLVREGLQPLLDELLATLENESGAITEATATGNPVMLHTLAGADLAGFARFPFRPAFLEARTFASTELGFTYPFPLRCLPGLGAFVGADIAAGAIAAGMSGEGGNVLLVDFGTNGEILLKQGNDFLATATAAGPAFEGGRLNCGSAVRTGVITAISLRDHRWHVRSHGKKTAWGISGSAYVDFLAVGLKAGWLNPFGRFANRPEFTIREMDGEPERVAYLSPEVFISEVDVAELLQAKAAIGGGIATLLEEADLAPGDLDHIFIGGGFGYHLRPDHAAAIGLLPTVPPDRYEIIGNASLAGASLALFSEYEREMNRIAERCTVVELNQINSFEDHFTDALLMEPF